jgi:uncharacterized membrane protein
MKWHPIFISYISMIACIVCFIIGVARILYNLEYDRKKRAYIWMVIVFITGWLSHYFSLQIP